MKMSVFFLTIALSLTTSVLQAHAWENLANCSEGVQIDWRLPPTDSSGNFDGRPIYRITVSDPVTINQMAQIFPLEYTGTGHLVLSDRLTEDSGSLQSQGLKISGTLQNSNNYKITGKLQNNELILSSSTVKSNVIVTTDYVPLKCE